jgi:uncharacterized membrane protein
MDTLLGAVHSLGWAVYVGGSLTMEIILRYAQRTMPPSQVAVVCKRAGSRYRWFGLAALVAIGVSGLAMALRLDGEGEAARRLALSDSYGRTFWAGTGIWAMLLAASASMAFWLHPAQARRSRPEMTEAEVRQERARVGVAIRRMDRVLKFELVASLVSLGLGASLRAGGVL